MSTWRRKALELLPDKRLIIESSESPAELWANLSSTFIECTKTENNDLIKRILKYANWCTSPDAGVPANDTEQAVYCGFLEDITRYHNNFANFKKWFSVQEFEKYKGSFMYALKEQEYKELEDLFYGK